MNKLTTITLLALTACGGAPFSAALLDHTIDEGGTDDGGAMGDSAMADSGTPADAGDSATTGDTGTAADSGTGHDSGSGPADSGSPPDDGGSVVVPPGWQLVEAAFGTSTPAACGAAWATNDTLLFDGLVAPAASCGCACGAPQSVTCALPAKSCTYDAVQGTCNCNPTQNLASGVCLPTGVGGAGGTPVASGGSCVATPSTSVPPLSWAGQARVCEPTGTATLPDLGFHLCIEQSGDVACPGVVFVNSHIEHVGANDDRSCSACTCGTPSGVSCGGTIADFKDTGCTQPNGDLGLNPTACSGYAGGGVEYQAAPSGGSCGAATVTPTGVATPTGDVTVCCR